MKKLVLTMFLLTAFISSALFAQAKTPLKLPSEIKSAWGKQVKYTVTAPNILLVKGVAADMDVINLKDIPYGGQKTLIIKIRAMEGKFRWDHGKMFGVVFGNPNKDKFLVPTGKREYKVMDRMVDGPFDIGEEVVFTLPADVVGKAGTIDFALTIYTGAQFEVEFLFQ